MLAALAALLLAAGRSSALAQELEVAPALMAASALLAAVQLAALLLAALAGLEVVLPALAAALLAALPLAALAGLLAALAALVAALLLAALPLAALHLTVSCNSFQPPLNAQRGDVLGHVLLRLQHSFTLRKVLNVIPQSQRRGV